MAHSPGSSNAQALGAPGPATAREVALVAILMAALTSAVLWVQMTHLDRVPEYGDVLFSIWRLAWVAHQLPSDPLHLYDANIFWPERFTFAYSDGMPLTGIVAAPLLWLGVPPVLVYSLLVVASFVLAGVFMYLFVRSLVGRTAPAFIAGVAFAFYSFRFEHYIHIELLSAFWMPLVLWSLHRTIRSGRMRDGVLTGLALAAQYLSSVYFGVFLAAYLVPVAVVAGWGRLRSTAKPLLVGAIVALVLIAPAVWPHLQVRAAMGERTVDDVAGFSAKIADYRAPYPRSAAYGRLRDSAQPAQPSPYDTETHLFPGFLLVLLACAALWPPLNTTRIAYLLGLALAFEASLGSNGFLYPLLYRWVLPFRGLRVPARYSMLVGLSLAILAGLAVDRILSRMNSRLLRAAIAAALCAVFLFESRPALAVQPLPAVPPVYAWFNGRPAATVLELPEWYPVCDRYLYFSTAHWQHLANGCSGAIPASYKALHAAMRDFPGDQAVAMLRARAIAYVIVHEDLYGSDQYRQVLERMEASGQFVEAHRATDGQHEARIYRVAGVTPAR